MRQAGRYLPEYRALRAKTSSFLEFCYTPGFAAEATLQPVRRFGLDAAILFSDILVVPDALGQKVAFEPNEGPKLDPISAWKDFAKLNACLDERRLSPVLETIARVKTALPAETALIGFCGAPWTVACYMVAGRAEPDQAQARLLAYRDRDLFQSLIDRLVEASVDYLGWQIESGVDAVQIFDTWAGVLPFKELQRWCFEPVAKIVAAIKRRHKNARVIGFPKGIGQALTEYGPRTGVDALGLDSGVNPRWAAQAFGNDLALQGNLDPLALVAGGQALEEGTAGILSAFRARRHIFNLGHGILPQTPVQHVEFMLKLIRGAQAA
jgi:uroporphyrinogen decarboxylase